MAKLRLTMMVMDELMKIIGEIPMEMGNSMMMGIVYHWTLLFRIAMETDSIVALVTLA